jgi:hypothetical protein
MPSFHLAIRSERAKEPTFSCPAFHPVARWTMATSSVSPNAPTRWWRKPLPWPLAGRPRLGHGAAWFGLISTQLQAPSLGGLPHAIGIGHQVVVADHLHPMADGARERDQPGFVVLGQRILDGDDRVALHPAHQPLAQRIGIELLSSSASR